MSLDLDNIEHQMRTNAGRMADLAIILLGGQDLNGRVPPAHPDDFSRYAMLLRSAAEQYNAAVLMRLRHTERVMLTEHNQKESDEN